MHDAEGSNKYQDLQEDYEFISRQKYLKQTRQEPRGFRNFGFVRTGFAGGVAQQSIDRCCDDRDACISLPFRRSSLCFLWVRRGTANLGESERYGRREAESREALAKRLCCTLDPYLASYI